MTNDRQEYNIDGIYELLLAGFTGETLQRFCRRNPPLKPILTRFGPGQGLDDMVDEVVEYCEKHALLRDLLVAVSRENPEQYARYHPDLGRSAPPPQTRRTAGRLVSRGWPRLALFVGLPALVLIVGVIVALSLLSGTSALNVLMWDIELDQKYDVIASQQFPGISGSVLSEDELQQVERFVEQALQPYGLDSEELQVDVYVPADLGSEELRIDVTPPGPTQLYFWIIDDEDKSRVPVNQEVLANLGEDFYFEISRPGYTSQIVQVRWGQEIDEHLTAPRQPLRIGIERFEGQENSIATQLAAALSTNPRISITDPDTLEALKETLAEEARLLEEHPELQVEYRTSLGLDLLISGSLE